MEENEYQEDKNKKNEDLDSDDFGLPELNDEIEGLDDDDQQEDAVEESQDEESDDEVYAEPSDFDKNEYEDSPVYVSHDQDEERNRTWLVLVLLVIVLALIGVAIWWFMFRDQPKPEPVAEPVQEQVEPEPEPEPVVEEPVFEPEPEPEPEPTLGEYQVLTSRTGAYYIVIASFVDEDLATDWCKILQEKGVSTNVLSPSGKGFFRVGLGGYDSFSDANAELGNYKAEYGEDIWVVKY